MSAAKKLVLGRGSETTAHLVLSAGSEQVSSFFGTSRPPESWRGKSANDTVLGVSTNASLLLSDDVLADFNPLFMGFLDSFAPETASVVVMSVDEMLCLSVASLVPLALETFSV